MVIDLGRYCRSLALLLSILLLGQGCGSTSRRVLKNYRQHLHRGQWQQALQLAKGEDFYPHERSKLLKLLEQGMLHHLQQEYFQAQKYFDEARKLSDRLFTVSLSKKALAIVGSDTLDNFYGEIYERSLLRFYSALNHYLLYQQGFYESYTKGKQHFPRQELSSRERRRHLDGARAMVLEWNAKIKQWRGEWAGATVYKDDILAKVFAAFIHQQVGGKSELNTARLLYRDAQRVLLQNYNAYPSFNHWHEKFKADFAQLPQLPPAEVEKKYISATSWAQDLSGHLQLREKSVFKKQQHNMMVVLHQGLIAAKRPKKYRFPLDLASRIKTIATGEMTVIDFCLQVLGMASDGGIPAIEFELPDISPQQIVANFSLHISQQGKLIQTLPLQLVNPLSDIAQAAIAEHALAIRLRLGARLAGKQIAAIASAYASYQAAVRSGTPKLAAEFIAAGIYLAANRAVALSEQGRSPFLVFVAPFSANNFWPSQSWEIPANTRKAAGEGSEAQLSPRRFGIANQGALSL